MTRGLFVATVILLACAEPRFDAGYLAGAAGERDSVGGAGAAAGTSGAPHTVGASGSSGFTGAQVGEPGGSAGASAGGTAPSSTGEPAGASPGGSAGREAGGSGGASVPVAAGASAGGMAGGELGVGAGEAGAGGAADDAQAGQGGEGGAADDWLTRPTPGCAGLTDVRVPAGMCVLIRGRFAGGSPDCSSTTTVHTCDVILGPSPDFKISSRVPSPNTATVDHLEMVNGVCPMQCAN